MALIKIPGVAVPAVDFDNSDAVEIGETVYAIGSPVGLEGTFSNGIVSGFRNVGEQRLIQITAPISPGSSGGPVTNSKGAVVGVAVATLKDGQNLNFAVPSNYLSQLRANATTVKPLAIAKSNTDKARSIGAPLTEGVIAHSFRWQNTLYGYFTLSLENKLRAPVGNVSCLVIFYNEKGLALDSSNVWVSGTNTGGIKRIEPGAAVRVVGKVEPEVVRLAGFVPRTVTEQEMIGRRDVNDPVGLVHQFPKGWAMDQINAYMEAYWKKRESRTKVRILSFEVLHD